MPHRHIVLTIPRLLGSLFQRDRALLAELFHAAQEVLGQRLRERTGVPDGQPGIVACVQTFGDYLNWHPHLHLLVTARVFRADRSFTHAPLGDWKALVELWRHAVIRRLLAKKAIRESLAHKLFSWRNSGFGLDAGEAPFGRYRCRGATASRRIPHSCPILGEKLQYESRTGNVLYRSSKHWRIRRNFEVFSAHQFIHGTGRTCRPKTCPCCATTASTATSAEANDTGHRAAPAATGDTHRATQAPSPTLAATDHPSVG